MNMYEYEYISERIGVLRPVLMIDKARIEVEVPQATTYCVLDESYPFWKYHFVNNPVMPGTYMVEMLAQSAAFFLMEMGGCSSVPIITGVNNVRFLREVKPNSNVKAEIMLKKVAGNYNTTQAKMIIDGKAVCKAEMVHYIK